MTYDIRNPYTWPAQDAKDAENSSPTTQPSHGPEPATFKTLQDRVEALLAQSDIQEMRLIAIERMLERLTEALAEDQDPDDLPATYLDGTPAR